LISNLVYQQKAKASAAKVVGTLCCLSLLAGVTTAQTSFSPTSYNVWLSSVGTRNAYSRVNGAVPQIGVPGTSVFQAASASGSYTTYFFLSSTRHRAWAESRLEGRINGGDAFGRSVIAGKGQVIASAGMWSYFGSVGRIGGTHGTGVSLTTLDSFGSGARQGVLGVMSGGDVRFSISASDESYDHASYADVTADYNIQAAVLPSSSGFGGDWSILDGSVYDSNPEAGEVTIKKSIGSIDLSVSTFETVSSRALMNFGFLTAASPFRDDLSVLGTLYVNDVAVHGFDAGASWLGGDNTISKTILSQLSGYTLALGGFLDGEIVNLRFDGALVHTGYDTAATIAGTRQLGSFSLSQSFSVDGRSDASSIPGPAAALMFGSLLARRMAIRQKSRLR
jgi:hypothetical protein